MPKSTADDYKMKQVLCFGDSVTAGEMDFEKGGWVSRVRARCIESEMHQPFLTTRIYNLGISGETTDGLVARCEGECAARFMKNAERIVLFQYGANDIVIHKQKNRVPISIFQKHCRTFFSYVASLGALPVSLSLLPVHTSLDGQINQHGETRRQDDVLQFNEMLEQCTREFDGRWVDLFSLFADPKHTKLWYSDFIHPSPLGHEAIADQVYRTLQ